MRNRLVTGVAITGLAVLAAGAPAVVSASGELNDSQRLVTLAEQARHTLALSHALADERDAVTEFVAQGRPAAGKAVLADRTGRTDRQIAEAQAEADEATAATLGRIDEVRAKALTGTGSALAAQQAYSGVLADLRIPGETLAEGTPPRAEAALALTRPLAPLGQAVEQASATRGLLLAALAVPRGSGSGSGSGDGSGTGTGGTGTGSSFDDGTGTGSGTGSSTGSGNPVVDELSAAAQRARVRELAALDDVAHSARPEVRDTLAATVTGPEVKTADGYLTALAGKPTLDSADRRTDRAAVSAALTARIDRTRSVESTLVAERATALAGLRDDDVTRLELVIAGLAVLFLLAVGVATGVARSLTRPLSVLVRGAARLATPEGSVEPVRFTGRNDEFAEVVRSLNGVRDQTVALHTRIAGLDADHRRLIGRNEALGKGRQGLEEELAELRAHLDEHRKLMSGTSVSLSLRTLGLVERQLTVIEDLESREQDPDRLATLFKLDHLATVMRRHNENLLVLAGQEHGHGQAGPVPLVDVARAAVSEIERYERVEITALPSFTQVAGHAADDVSHVLAELLENATTFSPPEAKVRVSGRILDTGEAVLTVVDEGIGVTPDRLAVLNARLSGPDAHDPEPEPEQGLGLGLYVAGRLAARHGVTAELRPGRGAGIEAVVVIPPSLLPTLPAPGVAPAHTLGREVPVLHLPGVVAEANEHTLPPRPRHAAPTPEDEAPASRDATTPAPAPREHVDPRAAAPRVPAPAEPPAAPAPAPAQAHAPAPAPRRTPEPDPFAAPGERLPDPGQVFTVGAAPAPPATPPVDTPTVRPLADRAPEPAAPAPPAPVPGARPEHGRVADLPVRTPGANTPAGHVPAPGTAPATPASEPAERLTDKGLPKRTPRSVRAARPEDGPLPGPTADARPEPRRVDAEDLRRRLSGFHQGAKDGRRDVEAEPVQGRDPKDQGDTVEEARS
ncbi:nitrate- and nitrite sensing domain-containing protein [Streptomyces sp. BI20]|uniref:sensor histidine kinase n=1 Tax=Streptomyces sp. BI20 TaxID=3403460 RepID=UPI003C72E2D5